MSYSKFYFNKSLLRNKIGHIKSYIFNFTVIVTSNDVKFKNML